ncbi:cuticular protein 11A [Haematobia irritans]|uniref:cuticular protein 11A n=1 Tax=Haematobia irritans TaxID=7368 RepID=UPI003F4F608A
MTRLIILLCAVVYVSADIKRLTDSKLDLFKYDPSDIYTLPEDIDDEKPAVVFEGDVMKAKVDKLQNLSGNKKFKLELKTQNGIEVSSVGKLKDDKTFVVSGSYSFTGADGKRYRTRYTADEFGYHPITELDLDIPEPQSLESGFGGLNNKFGLDDKRNRFQFLKQDLNADLDQSASSSLSRGSGQSGDDYSYGGGNGYDYEPPTQTFESDPSRQYLPAL